MNNTEKGMGVNTPEKTIDERSSVELADIKEQRTLGSEEVKRGVEELKESHPTWKIFFDKDGNPVGLPPGLRKGDAIFFLGNNGQWHAQNPSPELIEEIKMWRSDWMD